MNSNIFIGIITVTFTTLFSALIFLIVKKSFTKDVMSSISLVEKDVKNVTEDMFELKNDFKEISKSITSVFTSISDLKNNFLLTHVLPLKIETEKNKGELETVKKDINNLADLIRNKK